MRSGLFGTWNLSAKVYFVHGLYALRFFWCMESMRKGLFGTWNLCTEVYLVGTWNLWATFFCAWNLCAKVYLAHESVLYI